MLIFLKLVPEAIIITVVLDSSYFTSFIHSLIHSPFTSYIHSLISTYWVPGTVLGTVLS